jgi:anti-anti-sigma regulatory factor
MTRTDEPVASGWLRPPPQGRALDDLWAVYDGHYDEIAAETLAALENEEGLLETIRTYATQQSPDTMRALLADAFLSGRWREYATGLGSVGAYYAERGLAFSVWSLTLRAFRNVLRGRLVKAYGDTPARFADCVGAMEDLVDLMLAVITEEYLRQREATIIEQQAIRELSTPVLCVKPGLLVAPAVGVLDAARAEQLTQQLLEAIDQHRARVVVIDVTGIHAIDATVAGRIISTVAACRLMGASSVLSGLSAENAVTLGRIGADLGTLVPAGNLQDGIRRAEALLRSNGV